MKSIEHKILDHGFIKLIDHMGSDENIANAARVSYGKGTKKVSDDINLIRYLMKHRHTTPFEMSELQFHMRLPIFVARQIVRHRTASINEISGRYSEMTEDFYNPVKFREQSKNNRQGSSEETIDHKIQCYDKTYTEYVEMLNKGVARELSRIILPLSTYTEWIWKIDLHNLLHFLKLRLDIHAQWETRQYAKKIAEIVKELFPITWEAFVDYQLEAVTFSKQEIKILSEILKLNNEAKKAFGDLSKREEKDFKNKIKKLGIE
jgi:thymidylate synthase (FAD)